MSPFNSGWSAFQSVRLSPSILAYRGREILEKFRQRGIRIPPANRLEQAIRLTERANAEPAAVNAENAKEVYAFREAFRTLLEAFIIVHTIYDRPHQTAWYNDAMLGSLLRGAETEREEAKPHPRNTQFELFVAASLVLGGADVRQEEPDFRMLYDGDYVGIAVKRVRSLSEGTLRVDLVDAAQQIERSTGRGFVAMNLDRWIGSLNSAASLEDLGASFHKRVDAAHRTMFKLSDREAILGYLIYGTWFNWDFSGPLPRLEFHVPHQVRCFSTEAAGEQRCHEFFRPMQERRNKSLAQLFELISRPAV